MNQKLKLHTAKRYTLACAFTGMVLFAPAAFANEIRQSMISVSATGTATLAPDMAIVRLAVVRQAKTARQALDDNSKAMKKVMEALKRRGLEEKDIQTSNFNISPRYSRPRNSSSGAQELPKIIGYSVNNRIVVRVRKLWRLGGIMDQAITLGVNTGGGVSFTNSNPDGAIAKARKDAVARAFAKAKTLSKAARVKLGPISNITEQYQQGPRMHAMGRAMEASSAPRQVPIAAGENSYSVTVSVHWRIAK